MGLYQLIQVPPAPPRPAPGLLPTYLIDLCFVVAVPTAPPSKLGIVILDSQSLLIHWDEVPPDHRNGIIQGYALKYSSLTNGTSAVITLGEYEFSFKLKSLRKASVYEIRVWAFTRVGPGNSASQTVMTEEDGKGNASLPRGRFLRLVSNREGLGTSPFIMG